MITNMAVIEYNYLIKKRPEKGTSFRHLRHRRKPDDAVSGESLFLFWPFIYQIYSITARLVIILAYIIHTIMAKSTIQHKRVHKICYIFDM